MFCGINLIYLCAVAVVLTAVYMILQLLPFLAPFKNIINILFAAIVTIFVLLKVLAPLLSCSGL